MKTYSITLLTLTASILALFSGCTKKDAINTISNDENIIVESHIEGSGYKHRYTYTKDGLLFSDQFSALNDSIILHGDSSYTTLYTYANDSIHKVTQYADRREIAKTSYPLNSNHLVSYPRDKDTLVYNSNGRWIKTFGDEGRYDEISYTNDNITRRLHRNNANEIYTFDLSYDLNKQDSLHLTNRLIADYLYTQDIVDMNPYFGKPNKNLPTQMTTTYPKGGSQITNYTYTFDGNGRVLSMTIIYDNTAYYKTTFTYIH